MQAESLLNSPPIDPTQFSQPHLWNRFENLRDHLFCQHRDAPYVDDTGLPRGELEEVVASCFAENQHRSRVIQKARVTAVVLRQGQIAIDPDDWFVGKLDHGVQTDAVDSNCGGVVERLSLAWLDEAVAGPLTETTEWLDRARTTGQASVPAAGLDRGHISLGWDIMLSEGLAGLLARVDAARKSLGSDATDEQRDFYEAVEIVYSGAIELGHRFATLAESMAADLQDHADRLQIIASTMRQVPAHRPRTFHEALQFLWLMHELVEMEGERVRSMGQFDRTLYPYYRADIESGRLSREQAKELILFFWYKWYARTQGKANGKNFCFGGQHADGTEITNELTFLALDAYEQIRTPDPKLSVRLGPSAPDSLYRRVAELIRSGDHSFVLLNDPVAVAALVARGRSVEDARCYLPIGCYEPAVEGKEAGCTMNITVNLPKNLELALNDGKDPVSGAQLGPSTGDPCGFKRFEDLWKAYVAQLSYFLERSRDCIGAAEREWAQINPSPLLAGTFESCIARGKDIGQGGPTYNGVGFVGAGLANTADSLMAVKQVVFEEERLTMGELVSALAADFADQESLRQYLTNRVPKWGNNNDNADAMGALVAEHFCDTVHSFTNARGGPCAAALFTLEFALRGGTKTGALPDGRRAGESLAPGQGASYGRDGNGVTALLNSVVKLDGTKTPNGAVVDVTLHPSAVKGEDGLTKMVSLIKSYFARGGYGLQFNVFDTETLRDAQRYPERYASLQVRVTGWSVYFTSMNRLEQDQYIRRIAHTL